MKNKILKNLTIVLIPLSIFTAFAVSNNNNAPPPLGGVDKYEYQVGDKGPGGGFIFFVDYYNKYPDFTYLEAAPTDAKNGLSVPWCNNTMTSIPEVARWDANAIGRGRFNTNAMLAGCSSGAAVVANNYTTLTTTSGDWFLPSEGELMLMYTNLRQAGVGDFASVIYWSSTEFNSTRAWNQYLNLGGQNVSNKNETLPVRAIRAF